MAARDTRVAAVQLFGVLSLDGAHEASFGDSVSVVPFRDLAALVSDAPYVRLKASPDRILAYRGVIENVFARRSVLPAPFGTVFRSRDDLARWLELHYFTLADALGYVEDRAMVRVRVALADDARPKGDDDAAVTNDLHLTAGDSLRSLRRHAIASIPPALQAGAPPSVTASFLIERERWNAFTEGVNEETKRFPDLRIEQSGPWPPYDFVRMEFGG